MEQLYEEDNKKQINSLETIINKFQELIKIKLEKASSQMEYSKLDLQDLCIESKKLKSLEAMHNIPNENLFFLINMLENIINTGRTACPVIDTDEHSDLSPFFSKSLLEPLLTSADASIIALYILTSRNMPNQIYLDDTIDLILTFTSKHLQHTIYPANASFKILPSHREKFRHNKIFKLYDKFREILTLLSELFYMRAQTDTSVIRAISLGVTPFFVNSLLELQLSALPLVTEIFSKYEKHRRYILNDILTLLSKLSKSPIRNYRLISQEHIQIFTALVLHLFQSVVTLPEDFNYNLSTSAFYNATIKRNETHLIDHNIILLHKYKSTIIIASDFLNDLLNKLKCKFEGNNYPSIFKNFFNDLLTTLNKPEWPVTELLLSLLGKLLVKTFLNNSIDVCIRVSCLDYFGTLTARIRKNTLLSLDKIIYIDQLIHHIILGEFENDEQKMSVFKIESKINEIEKMHFLQTIILKYLEESSIKDPFHKLTRQFYIAFWYREIKDSIDKKNNNYCNKNRKSFLLSEMVAQDKNLFIESQTYIDYDNLTSISQYLASDRKFSKSFSCYLHYILHVLANPLQVLRTKAIKCLTMILEVDSEIINQMDIQKTIENTFLDQSKSVREAAVDSIGKIILLKPELFGNYYHILSSRLLDIGISVRKRVIRILKDICMKYPDHNKVPDICVKMIRRLNDEAEIRKLVMDFFKNFWFSPVKEQPSLECLALDKKVQNITKVISSNEINLELLEGLILNIFNVNSQLELSKTIQRPSEHMFISVKQLVDHFIEKLLQQEESSAKNKESYLIDEAFSKNQLVYMTALYLFAKVQPQLLVKHAINLQSYFSIKCFTKYDYQTIGFLAQTFELVVPLMENPSDVFISRLEEDSVKMILQHDKIVVDSCLSLISYIINNLTKNFGLIRDLFLKYYAHLSEYQRACQMNPHNPKILTAIPFIKRFLYIIGNLLKSFDFSDKNIMGFPDNMKDNVVNLFLYFIQHPNEEIQYYTLKAIGCFCIRYSDVMLQKELQDLYHKYLNCSNSYLQMKSQVLLNIVMILKEEDRRITQARSNSKNQDTESCYSNTIASNFLKEILELFLNENMKIRQDALNVISIILEQGLVYQSEIIPYLICLSTETENNIFNKARLELQEINKKYPGIIYAQVVKGILLSFKLQFILQSSSIPVRGLRLREDGITEALIEFLYSIISKRKQDRRNFILSILKQFNESKNTNLDLLLYLSDNLAYFSYKVQDEPLFIIQQIDRIISVSGTSVLLSFRHLLLPNPEITTDQTECDDFEEEDENENELMNRIPENIDSLLECISAFQQYKLLLLLKKHLKNIYGINEMLIKEYNSSHLTQIYEKDLNRRHSIYDPNQIISMMLKQEKFSKGTLVKEYLQFKMLLLEVEDHYNENIENRNEFEKIRKTN